MESIEKEIELNSLHLKLVSRKIKIHLIRIEQEKKVPANWIKMYTNVFQLWQRNFSVWDLFHANLFFFLTNFSWSFSF